MSETPQYKIGDVVNGHRWTGTEWQPVGAESPAAPAGADTSPKKPWFRKWWGIGLIAFGALVILTAAFGGGSTDTASVADESVAAAEQTPGDTTDEAAPVEEPKEELTVAQENAVRQAENYLGTSAFSKKGLIEQLEFEGYSKADAKFAVNYIDVDWDEQAALKAEEYLDTSAFSKQGLIEQLEFEGFTTAQAKFAVNNIDVDWDEQAALKAEEYLNTSAFSKQGLIEQLEFEGFTTAQAEYGVKSVGL